MRQVQTFSTAKSFDGHNISNIVVQNQVGTVKIQYSMERSVGNTQLFQNIMINNLSKLFSKVYLGLIKS